MKNLVFCLVLCLIGSLSALWIKNESSNFSCPPTNGSSILVPNPDNCTQFYSCGDSGAILLTCQPGLWFNPLISACDYPENVPEGTCEVPPVETTVSGSTTWSTTWWPNATDDTTVTDYSTLGPSTTDDGNTTETSTPLYNTTFVTDSTTDMGNYTTPWINGTTLWPNSTGNPGNDTDYYW